MCTPSLSTIQRILREDQHVLSRAPNSVVSNSARLTSYEKTRLGDLFEAYIETPERSSKPPPILSELYKDFIGHIFDSWVSTQTTNMKPLLPPRPSHRTCIEIKISQAGSRMQGSRCSFEPTIHRPVFLNMDFDSRDASFDWTWHHGDNNPITLNIELRLPRGVTKKDAMVMAIEHYDNMERERIMSHNRIQIISAARRRFSKWAQAGSDLRGKIDNEDLLKDGDIFHLILASDMFIKAASEGADVAATLQRRRVER